MTYRDNLGMFASITRTAAILIVTVILLLNIVALALSFDPVYDMSHRTYSSGIDGSLPLPDLTVDSGALIVQMPTSVVEGEPFKVRVATMDGETPAMPLFIRFESSNGSVMDTALHDDIDSDGNWFSWTIVQGRIPSGNHEVWIGYRGHGKNIPFNENTGNLTVTETNDPFVTVGSFDNVISNRLASFDVRGPFSEMIDELDISIEGKQEVILLRDPSGDFFLDLDSHYIVGWKRIEIGFISNGETYLEELIVHFPKDSSNTGRGVELRIDQPLNEFDDLFNQDPLEDENGEGGVQVLLTSTYYRYDLEMMVEERGEYDQDGFPDVPISFPVMFVEGRRVDLRPGIEPGIFSGFSRTPSSYSDDGMEGILVDFWPFEKDSAFINRTLLLRERQSPSLIIHPDPFGIKDEIPEEFDISIVEGYELVSYRIFKESAHVELDGITQEATRDVIDTENGKAVEYEVMIPDGFQGGELTIQTETGFEMEVWISFIFFLIPEPISGLGVPIWFTLISIAICLSIFNLLRRSVIDIERKDKANFRVRDPFSIRSDISILSKTFIGALFFSWAVVFLLEIMEQPTPVPDILSDETPIWIRMILLADASVWEEIVSRVMFIGLPLLVINRSGKWDMERWKILLGGQGRFGTAEVVLILLSSSFFGLAHLGWGPWKVIPTFVTGALFGYLYVKVGLHAAIAMHFLFDYNSFIYELTDLSYLPLYVLMLFSLSIGAFFLAEVMTGFKGWIEEKAARRIDPKWMLVIHSSLTMLLMIYLYIKGADPGPIVLLGFVPILEGGGYFLWKRFDLRSPSIVMVSFASLITLALAPIGLIWIFDEHNMVNMEFENIRADTPQRNLLRAPPRYQRRHRHS